LCLSPLYTYLSKKGWEIYFSFGDKFEKNFLQFLMPNLPTHNFFFSYLSPKLKILFPTPFLFTRLTDMIYADSSRKGLGKVFSFGDSSEGKIFFFQIPKFPIHQTQKKIIFKFILKTKIFFPTLLRGICTTQVGESSD